MSFRTLTIALYITTLCYVATGQSFCGKFDFNQSYLMGFSACYGKYPSVFVPKDYLSNPEIRPYRPTSRYFLGSIPNTYSCMESNNYFSMNANTRIEAAIYLKSDWNSFLRIIVMDVNQNRPIHTFQIEPKFGNWFLFQEEIRTIIPNAKVRLTLCPNSTTVKIDSIYRLKCMPISKDKVSLRSNIYTF